MDVAAAADDNVKMLDTGGSLTTSLGGTSFAAPHVAGATVLVWARWSGSLSASTVRGHLEETARPPDEPFANDPNQVGGGVLDITNAFDVDPCTYQDCGSVPN